MSNPKFDIGDKAYIITYHGKVKGKKQWWKEEVRIYEIRYKKRKDCYEYGIEQRNRLGKITYKKENRIYTYYEVEIKLMELRNE